MKLTVTDYWNVAPDAWRPVPWWFRWALLFVRREVACYNYKDADGGYVREILFLKRLGPWVDHRHVVKSPSPYPHGETPFIVVKNLP